MTKPKIPKPKRRREKPEEHPKHEPVKLRDFERMLVVMVKTPPLSKRKK
jgi:hypothetical protein